MNEQAQSPSAIPFFEKDDGELNIVQVKLIDFLHKHGFGKVYVESEMSSSLVRVEEGIVHRTSKERIRDFVMETVRCVPDDGVPKGFSKKDFEDLLIRTSHIYFGSDFVTNLPRLDIEFNRDTREEAFFYFGNCAVRVRKDRIEQLSYDELDGAVWADQIINRRFELLPDKEVLTGSHWFQFLNNVMGGGTARTNALWTALGYLLHGYKDPVNAKAIVFLDEAISDVPDGRTGKSLVAEALQKLVPVHRIDARNFRFGGQFSFQSIGIEHQVVDFNDASEDFAFEKLFSLITDDMQVERKYQDEVTIPFDDAPKILISTNHVIEGEGSSFEDRVFQIEFAPRYNASHRPVDDFEKRFFEEWGKREWRRFDNLMMLFVQMYLRDGLKSYKHENLSKRRLRQETSPEFAEWILAEDPGEYNKKELFEAFKADLGDDFVFAGTQKQFTRWCHAYGRIYTRSKLPTRKSGGDRFITIPELEDGS